MYARGYESRDPSAHAVPGAHYIHVLAPIRNPRKNYWSIDYGFSVELSGSVTCNCFEAAAPV